MSAIDQMNEMLERAERLLPAWFIPRMTDVWYFGLLLETGQVFCISNIIDVRQGSEGIWIEVEMLDEVPSEAKASQPHLEYIVAPTPRLRASVQASKIVAAFELAST
jgi:hypothetical protein